MIIDELPSVSSAVSTDEIPVERGTLTYKSTLSVIANAVSSILGLGRTLLYFMSQAVSATTGQIMRIPASGSNSSITANTVVLECSWANPSAITTDVTWTSYAGYIVFNGTCSTATTANVVLGQKNN